MLLNQGGQQKYIQTSKGRCLFSIRAQVKAVGGPGMVEVRHVFVIAKGKRAEID